MPDPDPRPNPIPNPEHGNQEQRIERAISDMLDQKLAALTAKPDPDTTRLLLYIASGIRMLLDNGGVTDQGADPDQLAALDNLTAALKRNDDALKQAVDSQTPQS